MAREGIHFMAVLGVNAYTDCVYEVADAGFACQTPFVQMAVAEYVMSEYREGDRITIFVTKNAEINNWLDRDFSDAEIARMKKANIEPAPGEKRAGLEKLLKTAYPQTPVEKVEILEGRNKEELDKIFEAIYETIHPGETIVFDITHGLRNIPMQALTIIHYAKALKGIKVGGIFYGAFELGVADKKQIPHVELQDMSACNTILDWTSAAEAFVKGGSSNQIRDLYKKGDGKNVLVSLYDMTNCLETCRGKTKGCSQKQSIHVAYGQFRDYYHKMCENPQPLSEVPLRRLLDWIREDVEIFGQELRRSTAEDEEPVWFPNTATGMAVIEWAINKEGLTQQGFTALEETIKTYVCEMYRLPSEDQATREIVGGTLKYTFFKCYMSSKKNGVVVPPLTLEEACSGRLEELEKDRHYQRLAEEEKDRYRKAVAAIIKERPEALFKLSGAVSTLRNTLNHFGFQNESPGYEKIQKALKTQYDKWKEIMLADGVEWVTDEGDPEI